MKYHHGLGIIALAAYPVLALRPHGHHGISRRADDTCRIQLAQSNGGRKVAFAIDSSGSMASSDPAFLRVEASKQLTRQLVSTPGNGKSADQLAVVE